MVTAVSRKITEEDSIVGSQRKNTAAGVNVDEITAAIAVLRIWNDGHIELKRTVQRAVGVDTPHFRAIHHGLGGWIGKREDVRRGPLMQDNFAVIARYPVGEGDTRVRLEVRVFGSVGKESAIVDEISAFARHEQTSVRKRREAGANEVGPEWTTGIERRDRIISGIDTAVRKQAPEAVGNRWEMRKSSRVVDEANQRQFITATEKTVRFDLPSHALRCREARIERTISGADLGRPPMVRRSAHIVDIGKATAEEETVSAISNRDIECFRTLSSISARGLTKREHRIVKGCVQRAIGVEPPD